MIRLKDISAGLKNRLKKYLIQKDYEILCPAFIKNTAATAKKPPPATPLN
jgi:hypothetical protein